MSEKPANKDQSPWPLSIQYSKSKKRLFVTYDNGQEVSITAERLRVESPSAEVQGHHPSEKKIIKNKENVTITDMQAVGNYAVRLIFDDGHSSGLYTWSYLYELAQKQ